MPYLFTEENVRTSSAYRPYGIHCLHGRRQNHVCLQKVMQDYLAYIAPMRDIVYPHLLIEQKKIFL